MSNEINMSRVTKAIVTFYDHPVAVPRTKIDVLNNWYKRGIINTPERVENARKAVRLYERQEQDFFNNMSPRLPPMIGFSPDTVEYIMLRSREICEANRVELEDVVRGIMPNLAEPVNDVAPHSTREAKS